MESKCVALAKEIICTYLGTNITPEGCSAIYNIRSGDTEELICHIKAMISIFESAKIDLEQEVNKNG